jgi:hypothetical protein
MLTSTLDACSRFIGVGVFSSGTRACLAGALAKAGSPAIFWANQLLFTQGITHSRPDIRCRPDRQNTRAGLRVSA